MTEGIYALVLIGAGILLICNVWVLGHVGRTPTARVKMSSQSGLFALSTLPGRWLKRHLSFLDDMTSTFAYCSQFCTLPSVYQSTEAFLPEQEGVPARVLVRNHVNYQLVSQKRAMEDPPAPPPPGMTFTNKQVAFGLISLLIFIAGGTWTLYQDLGESIRDLERQIGTRSSADQVYRQNREVQAKLDLLRSTIQELHPNEADLLRDLNKQFQILSVTAHADIEGEEPWGRIIDSDTLLTVGESSTGTGVWALSAPSEAVEEYRILSPTESVVKSIESYMEGAQRFYRMTLETSEHRLEIGRITKVKTSVGKTLQRGEMLGKALAASPVCLTLKVTRLNSKITLDVRRFQQEYMGDFPQR